MSKPTSHNNWATFLIAIGGILIAISPMTSKYYNIITGLLLIGLGLYRLKK